MSNTVKLKRSQAVEILRDIRKELYQARACRPEHAARVNREMVGNLIKLLEANGIEPLAACPGEAHSVGEGMANGNIDHCSVCMGGEGWGIVGNKISVS